MSAMTVAGIRGLFPLFLLGVVKGGQYHTVCDRTGENTVYDYNTRRLDGFTPQYWQLNALMSELSYLPFIVIGFPCNQFGHQEPGDNGTEILNGLYYVRPGQQYSPLFPLMSKVDVNGQKEHPLFSYLKGSCTVPLTTVYRKTESFWDPLRVNDIAWNFEKFIIDQNGYPVLRFKPEVEPKQLRGIIAILMEDRLSREEKEVKIFQELQKIEQEIQNPFEEIY